MSLFHGLFMHDQGNHHHNAAEQVAHNGVHHTHGAFPDGGVDHWGMAHHGETSWVNFGSGTGEHDAGMMGVEAHGNVPWINFGPQAMHHDADRDGVADALDTHVGPGAADLSPGAMSSGVPWQQATPSAMHHDADSDGVPDALDNHVGPGAWK